MDYNRTYSEELQNSFRNEDWMENASYSQLLTEVEEGFEKEKRVGKQLEMESFTYLLLDPRITNNLPVRARNEPRGVVWKSFIDSIFYIGKAYSEEMQNSFRNEDWMENASYSQLLTEVEEGFEKEERVGKQLEMESFTYLLLDPRITNNLPVRARNEPRGVVWKSFIDSIFYIGKGRGERGYCPFKNALKLRNKGINTSNIPKIQQILDIWSANLGVLILHVFDFRTSREALTYEAAMIDVIGKTNLTTKRSGNYCGVAKQWPPNMQRMLGLYLLRKALNIHICEGERQLKPEDI